jgi:NagD protein
MAELKVNSMEALRAKKGYIIDMDGVIYHGNMLLPGVTEFVSWLKRENKAFLFLTNSSERSPRELSEKLARLGLEVDESHFYTSALSTAAFLKHQARGAACTSSANPAWWGAVRRGLHHERGQPDYVVLGETHTYSFDRIQHAVTLVRGGAKLIGTNPDITGPIEAASRRRARRSWRLSKWRPAAAPITWASLIRS